MKPEQAHIDIYGWLTILAVISFPFILVACVVAAIGA